MPDDIQPSVWLQPNGAVEAANFHDKKFLGNALEQLVGFDRTNSGETRLAAWPGSEGERSRAVEEAGAGADFSGERTRVGACARIIGPQVVTLGYGDTVILQGARPSLALSTDLLLRMANTDR